jgi:hypothetical protein
VRAQASKSGVRLCTSRLRRSLLMRIKLARSLSASTSGQRTPLPAGFGRRDPQRDILRVPFADIPPSGRNRRGRGRGPGDGQQALQAQERRKNGGPCSHAHSDQLCDQSTARPAPEQSFDRADFELLGVVLWDPLGYIIVCATVQYRGRY